MNEAPKATMDGGRPTGAAVLPQVRATDDRADRTQRILLATTSLGRQITEAITEQLGDHELATNTPILVPTHPWRNGPQRPRALQGLARLSSGGMTKQLDHLEELRLVERSFGQVKGDRRAIMVSLTPAGREVAEQVADAVEAHASDIRALVRELDSLL